MIKGIEQLSKEQQEFMLLVNQKQIDCMGTERKEQAKIIECWLDETDTVCVRHESGEWYHYYSDGTWG